MATPAVPAKITDFLSNHVLLPRKLPGKPEPIDRGAGQVALTQRLLKACRTVYHMSLSKDPDASQASCRALEASCRMLHLASNLNALPHLDKKDLKEAFASVENGASRQARRFDRQHTDYNVSGVCVVLYISAQNAGLIAYRQGSEVIFEAFEASAQSAAVLEAISPLEWDFPCCAASVPLLAIENSHFQEHISRFLEQSSREVIKRLAPTTSKATSNIFENRDTVSPTLISTMLMSLLEAEGSSVCPPTLRKHVRDDVCWEQGSEVPWRRSPYYTVARVALQRSLCRTLGGEPGRVYYKFIMCLFISQLCDDFRVASLDPEVLATARAKLARRLAKLESESQHSPQNLQVIYKRLFSEFTPHFKTSLQAVEDHLSRIWELHKRHLLRPVRPLPHTADPGSLVLSLPISRQPIAIILTAWKEALRSSRPLPTKSFASSVPVSAVKTNPEMATYITLAETELTVEKGGMNHKDISEIASAMTMYKTMATAAYDGDPEQKSIMILTIMDMWLLLDVKATSTYPLLRQYDPGFTLNMMDDLNLPRLADMIRLHRVERHLKNRVLASDTSRPSIFGDPAPGSFAVSYFDRSASLQTLHDQIWERSHQARTEKENEWRRKSSEYEELIRKVNNSTCLYTTNESEPLVRIHDNHRCQKCFVEREANRLRITVHEAPLSENIILASTVLFELQIPAEYQAYRSITWQILRDLGHAARVANHPPILLLHEYQALRDRVTMRADAVCLASRTKPFQMTHYATRRFPTDLDNVCLSNGLKVGLYDQEKQLWTAGKQNRKPSFALQCVTSLGPKSPFAVIQGVLNGADNTPNDIVASQGYAPSTINGLEFVAVQDLVCGIRLQWIRLIRELGCTSLNFSTDATSQIVTRMALRAGPSLDDDVLRAGHWVFRDHKFCSDLMSEIEKRLEVIANNWREAQCMNLLMTLTLRLCSLAPTVAAKELFLTLRRRTLGWVRALRSEVHNATDAATSDKRSADAWWAAFLCRRTFSDDQERSVPFGKEDLQAFVEASITLQDNSRVVSTEVPSPRRRAQLQDWKLVGRFQAVLRQTIETSPVGLQEAVDAAWPLPDGASQRQYSPWTFQDDVWVTTCIVPTSTVKSQKVHYNILEGKLLVDGRPLGKLPSKYRNHESLKLLFGDRALLVFPSGVRDMTHTLASLVEGHQIHFGFHADRLIIRVLDQHHNILQFLPRNLFTSEHQGHDLPRPLIEDCVHWLDLRTGTIDIRRTDAIWRNKRSNWILDMNTNQAKRRQSYLVDPHSQVLRQLELIFRCFESTANLLVSQPPHGGMSVDLGRFELRFSVNRSGLLQSRELNAFIDTNQDPGVFYGLDSKIVLRDVTNRRDRSIIVPLSPFQIVRDSFHVKVTAIFEPGQQNYCTFALNEQMNRLDCPAEPMLLYTKAFLHATTSFILQDLLTGRTGVDEALNCLMSASSQPWGPLRAGPFSTLKMIASLSPKRVYYPGDLKVMQLVTWSKNLTTSIQHDEFRPAVQRILDQSNELLPFYNLPQYNLKQGVLSIGGAGELHLLKRAQDNANQVKVRAANECQPYYTRAMRDRQNTKKYDHVYEIAALVKQWPQRVPATEPVAGILQQWSRIAGYTESFDKVILSDIVELDVPSSWGAIFNYCRASSGLGNRYRVLFFMSLLTFGNDHDMNIMRTIASFAMLKRFQGLQPPQCPSYINFRYGQVPSSQLLLPLIERARVPYPQDERSLLGFAMAHKETKKFRAAERAYEKECSANCDTFAKFLLEQWPCPRLNVENFPGDHLINIDQALESIQPEWERLYQNHQLSRFVDVLQKILTESSSDSYTVTTRPYLTNPSLYCSLKNEDQWMPSMSEMLCIESTEPPSGHIDDLSEILTDEETTTGSANPLTRLQPWEGSAQASSGAAKNNIVAQEVQQLQRIVSDFATIPNTTRSRYAKDLENSLDALKGKGCVTEARKDIDRSKLAIAITQARSGLDAQIEYIRLRFMEDTRASWLIRGGVWSKATLSALLQALRSSTGAAMSASMRQTIMRLAMQVAWLQRLLRIQRSLKKLDHNRLLDEITNTGHEYWNPYEYPEWLLLEIDANLLIRPDQIDVALATIMPSSGLSSVTQMNMGQGKTSTIIPMVASVLGNRQKLVRIVVPKPLLLMMAQLLQTRLGVLLNRKIRHIPFSRRTSTAVDMITTYHRLHAEMLREGGVILALPEHMLSFKLSGVQRLSDSKHDEAQTMVKVQEYLDKVSRDVLDECDHTLAVRTQLVYPSGSQATVDGHPHRWTTIQTILQLVEGFLWNLQADFRHGLEVVRRSRGGYPLVYFLRKQAEEALVNRIVDTLCSGRSLLPMERCAEDERHAIRQFISEPRITKSEITRIERLFKDRASVKQNLFLLRGLFVHRLLTLALGKRWNVQYGIHPGRDPIAVPFSAKGVPSEQAEWGHPDVAILFTCLSFYHQGLLVDQMRQSLEMVLKSDDPGSEYDRWSQACGTLPDSLRDFTSINPDDDMQLQELWKHFGHRTIVVDHFLNHFVFPKHAKQFKTKIQASGWDLPLFNVMSAVPAVPIGKENGHTSGVTTIMNGGQTEIQMSTSMEAVSTSHGARRIATLTTGFSGTNDNKTMLPLTIKQQDLPTQSHTNAEVLTYLLQSRNSRYFLAANNFGARLTERAFLYRIMELGIRVLIDAGAQILEMDNIRLVEAWLTIDTAAPAAIFFDENDKAIVHHRDGHKLPLLASPYAENSGDCLVYLDQAHTRGVDLKMPAHARGALTLALGQTKDHTVQGKSPFAAI